MRISDWSSDVCSSDLRMKTGKSYAKPMDIGDVIVAATVGEVLESQSDALPVGTMVAGYLGWQEKAIARAKHLQMIPATGGVSPSAYLGAAGQIGRASCRERVCQYV